MRRELVRLLDHSSLVSFVMSTDTTSARTWSDVRQVAFSVTARASVATGARAVLGPRARLTLARLCTPLPLPSASRRRRTPTNRRRRAVRQSPRLASPRRQVRQSRFSALCSRLESVQSELRFGFHLTTRAGHKSEAQAQAGDSRSLADKVGTALSVVWL